MMQFIKPLRSGQITIPVEFRQKLGIDKHTVLNMRLEEGELRIKPMKVGSIARDATWFKKLAAGFKEVHKEAQTYSEDEVNEVITKTVSAVRKSHV